MEVTEQGAVRRGSKPKAETASTSTKQSFENLWLSRAKHPGLSKKELDKKLKESALICHRKPPKPSAPIIGRKGDYQADLMFFPYKKHNDNYGIILNIIHVPTRYLFSYLLKKKSDTASAFENLLPSLAIKAENLTVDKGREFINKKLEQMLADHDVNLISINKSEEGGLSPYSLAIVERVNKTVRDLIERYISVSERTGKEQFRFIDDFEQLIKLYNESPHSYFDNNKTPAQAFQEYSTNRSDITSYLTLQKQLLDRKSRLLEKIKKEFPIGSLVHIYDPKSTFEKSSVARASEDIWRVTGRSGYRLTIEDDEGNTQT